jgi:MerR family transcriptional regulator, light-induced transcriptional regulator
MIDLYEELGETSRRQILSELRTGPKNVTEIVESTGLKQPNVSNHLARMKNKQVVRSTKTGREVFYSLASPEIEAIVNSAFSIKRNEEVHLDIDQLAKTYAKLAIQGDEMGCAEILDQAFRAHMPMVDIYQDLLTPAMTMVGTWYKVEAIDEAQEHMASAITERMMARTVQITGPARRQDKTALLGCAPNSWHVIGLRMLGDYLRFCGWKSLFLGANCPIPSFLTAVEQHNPHIVLLSCGATEGLEDTISMVKALNAFRGRKSVPLIGVGGHCIIDNLPAITAAGADFTAKSLRQFGSEILPYIEKTGKAPQIESEAA